MASDDGGAAPRAPSPPMLRALTGVRFVAAFQVVLFHCTHWRTWGDPAPLRNVVGGGFVAVGFFFVLSGFILAYTHGEDGDGARAKARRSFYVSRFARIYPVYVLGLALTAPFFVVSHLRAHTVGRMVVEAAAVGALVQAYVPSLAMAWNSPSWSLSVEAFFYALFPFIAAPVLRLSRAGASALAIVACVVAVAFPVAYLATVPDGVAHPTSETVAFYLDALKFNPVARLPEFVLGIALGRLFGDEAFRVAVARHAALLAPAAVVVVVGVLAAGDAIPYPLVHNGLLAPVFAALIVALAAGVGPLARALGAPGAVLLGEASYALYILHVPLEILVRKAGSAALGESFPETSAFVLLYLVVTIPASIASYRFIEVPLRGRLRRALLGPGSPARGGRAASSPPA